MSSDAGSAARILEDAERDLRSLAVALSCQASSARNLFRMVDDEVVEAQKHWTGPRANQVNTAAADYMTAVDPYHGAVLSAAGTVRRWADAAQTTASDVDFYEKQERDPDSDEDTVVHAAAELALLFDGWGSICKRFSRELDPAIRKIKSANAKKAIEFERAEIDRLNTQLWLHNFSSPAQVRLWWAGLTDQERLTLLATNPDGLRDREGVPADIGDIAELAQMIEDLDRLEELELEGNLTDDQRRELERIRNSFDPITIDDGSDDDTDTRNRRRKRFPIFGPPAPGGGHQSPPPSGGNGHHEDSAGDLVFGEPGSGTGNGPHLELVAVPSASQHELVAVTVVPEHELVAMSASSTAAGPGCGSALVGVGLPGDKGPQGAVLVQGGVWPQDEIVAVPVAPQHEIVAVPVASQHELVAVPVASQHELVPVPAALTAAGPACGSAMVGEGLPGDKGPHGAVLVQGDVCSQDDLVAVPVASQHELVAVPVASHNEIVAAPVVPEHELVAVPVASQNEIVAAQAGVTPGLELACWPPPRATSSAVLSR